MNQHLDLDALADVLAGGVDPHLEACPACQARLAELSAALPSVAAALTALPDPVPPADLDARLAGVLAEARTSTSADVLPLVRRPRPRRWLPAFSAVAAAAVLVSGGLLVAQGGSPGGTSQDTAGAPTYAVSTTGNAYSAKGGSLEHALPSLLAGDAKSVATAQDAAGSSQPLSEMQSRTSTKGAGPLTPPATDPLAELRTTSGLARCLASLTDPDDAGVPLALDYATFEGAPALVVVLPSTKADKVDVLVVPPGCAQADGRVLYFTRLPKP
ncbi:MAG TPA: hypothetical protein VMZ11_03340 [Mycobacteriales bacterium]|nr:hypothetical protein [Mycobacteriales bacterium]